MATDPRYRTRRSLRRCPRLSSGLLHREEPMLHIRIPQTGTTIEWPSAEAGRVRIKATLHVRGQVSQAGIRVQLSFKRDPFLAERQGALPRARGWPRRVAGPARRAGAGADQGAGGRDYLVADTGWASRSETDGELRGIPQAGRGSVWPTPTIR